MRSTQPFPETLKSLREMQGLSERQVSKRAERHGGQHHSVMSSVYRGDTPPLPHHLIAVAAALGVAPETFAEYRLFQVIHLFDIVGNDRRSQTPVTFEQAVHNLSRFEELTAAASQRRVAARAPDQVVDVIEKFRVPDQATDGHA